ncbi:MAG: DegV family EDD domain-containing protein [Lachnospiraceae bacterium]|nr:DegV family EDD domain-containing protein [Lachnospiraceae bacterium]
MKEKIRNLIKYLFDWQEDVQDRLFLLLTSIALCGIVLAFIGSIIVGESLVSIMSLVVGFFVFFPIAWLGYRNRRIRDTSTIVAFLLVLVFFPIIFFTSGGIRGGAPLWFVFAILYIGMILRGRVRIFFSLAQVLVIVFCYYIQYTHPECITPHDEYEFFTDSLCALLIVGLILTLLMSFQTYVYRRENEILKSQKEEIEKLNKAQNRFFSSMSHEIRTPINTIIGLNEMILREKPTGEIAEDSLNIQAASNMLLHLVNDILDMSRLQAGQVQLSQTPYNTKDMLLDVISMLQVAADNKGLEFNVNIDPELPAELSGDEVRLKQILINILNNAIKYTEEGFVKFSVQCENPAGDEVSVVYSVSDSGIGIKRENIDDLFSAFRRMDEEKNKGIEGTGLGLSIVKQFVDLMGGKITVNSVYTKGSTFIIEIPQKVINREGVGQIDSGSKREINKIAEYHQSFEAPRARVLVVDDTATNLMVVRKLLKETKVTVDTASGGERALEMTLENSYHVIFMDHLMPGMDGIECMHRIQNQTGGLSKTALFVALTANTGNENRFLYEKEGFDGYLTKPIKGNAIEEELHGLLPKELITMDKMKGVEYAESGLWISGSRKKIPVMITTSSTADIPDELIKKYNMAVIPITIETEDGCFRDSIDIDSAGVLSYMIEEGRKAQMNPLNQSEYETFFAEQLQHANNIIHISVSSKVHANSYMASVDAAKSFENVRVVDTGQISTGQGILALAAAGMAEDGMDPDTIINKLEILKKEVTTSFIVDNMDYLAGTKKVSPGIAKFTRAFMIRSVLCFRNGRIFLSKVYFGSKKRAWHKYISYALRNGKTIDRSLLFITHVGLSRKELLEIKEAVGQKVAFDKIYFQKASPAIATTTGPGTFGLLFWRLDDFHSSPISAP